MLNLELVRKIETPEENIPLILEYDRKYGEKIEKIAAEYILTGSLPACIPYTDDEERMEAHKRGKTYAGRAAALSEVPQEQAMLAYLFWLHCLPFAWKFYTLLGIDETVFCQSLRDITYKTRECLAVRGYLGVFVDWFFLFFDMKILAFGRLQYELATYPYDTYRAGGYTLHKGDPVLSIHVPSCGPLKKELCFDSFRQAYAFFHEDIPGTVLPIVIHSWLLYPPYLGVTFPEDSNVGRFARMFDVVHVNPTEEFNDCWRIFSKDYSGSTGDLPSDTGMRRRFIDYLNAGGTHGWASGVLLYDGEKDMIINR